MVRKLLLPDGARIAVIGGGPAGVFFSLFAFQRIIEDGRRISIVLFDGKDFTQAGPKGCNLCAGVISESLVRRLADRGIVLPQEKVQRTIGGYYLQSGAGEFLLKQPQHESSVTTVFRGNGPRLSRDCSNVSFDDFLLDQLRKLDLNIVSQPVVDIEFSKSLDEKTKVVYGIGAARTEYAADLVVGAFGLSSSLAKKITDSRLGYRPPRTQNARCMEVPVDSESIRGGLDDNIVVCNWKSNGEMLFGAIIPKRNYITINIIGGKNVARKDIIEFANLPFIRAKLSDHIDLARPSCQCSPKIALTSARRPFAHRFVVIGDACCSRHYKNGIESAMVTAEKAVDVVFTAGVSRSALRSRYYRCIKRDIIIDNIYGRILFGLYKLVYNSSFFSAVLLRVLEEESRTERPGLMSNIRARIFFNYSK